MTVWLSSYHVETNLHFPSCYSFNQVTRSTRFTKFSTGRRSSNLAAKSSTLAHVPAGPWAWLEISQTVAKKSNSWNCISSLVPTLSQNLSILVCKHNPDRRDMYLDWTPFVPQENKKTNCLVTSSKCFTSPVFLPWWL